MCFSYIKNARTSDLLSWAAFYDAHVRSAFVLPQGEVLTVCTRTQDQVFTCSLTEWHLQLWSWRSHCTCKFPLFSHNLIRNMFSMFIGNMETRGAHFCPRLACSLSEGQRAHSTTKPDHVDKVAVHTCVDWQQAAGASACGLHYHFFVDSLRGW